MTNVGIITLPQAILATLTLVQGPVLHAHVPYRSIVGLLPSEFTPFPDSSYVSEHHKFGRCSLDDGKPL